jgi:hypothetical protein
MRYAFGRIPRTLPNAPFSTAVRFVAYYRVSIIIRASVYQSLLLGVESFQLRLRPVIYLIICFLQTYI